MSTASRRRSKACPVRTSPSSVNGRDGDLIEIGLPMALHLDPLPGAADSNPVAVLYGPIVAGGANWERKGWKG